MAQDCLKILKKKPFFAKLKTQSAALAQLKSSLKQNLGASSSSDMESETTRATRESAASNDESSFLKQMETVNQSIIEQTTKSKGRSSGPTEGSQRCQSKKENQADCPRQFAQQPKDI